MQGVANLVGELSALRTVPDVLLTAAAAAQQPTEQEFAADPVWSLNLWRARSQTLLHGVEQLLRDDGWPRSLDSDRVGFLSVLGLPSSNRGADVRLIVQHVVEPAFVPAPALVHDAALVEVATDFL